MKKVLLLLSWIVIVVPVYSQTNSAWASKSIYEVGDPISTCESNFENLLHNWNKENITNAGDFHIIGYTFVEELNNQELINNYINSLTGNDALFSRVSSHMSGSGDSLLEEQNFDFFRFRELVNAEGMSKEEAEKMMMAFEKERATLKKAADKILNKGDKVYAVFFRNNESVYTNYVICDGVNNLVIWDNLFQNIKVKDPM
ncbi:hypothetical protein [Echinicola salinicaeni]|uniref:hypothetical protein n=1 Tax=Echinicola salinicaeni TaxID=2762757 RepID=UPI0016481E9A|nr:hypothetical protein [Echinicola salinicaeni]